MGTTTRHARGAEDAIDTSWGERPGYVPTSAEILGWLAATDMVVVSQRRLRWFIDKLTDHRNSEAERLAIVAHHPFWDSYREPDEGREAGALAVPELGRDGTASGIEGTGSC
ncbi:MULTISPECIES: hypothetical protein [unclassified Methylobacterium]|uniref:hypothetical protein n=1 Tax=unclassified Methylobacterium TaxID=2615210 RepID=UPI0011C1FF42|nr:MULTISPECIES: hypothetical protein [unclassified Methylobacterium]QEE39838.1 hypothetical protein FVA80_13620 [Methylobacterium sp. WL1]TXN57318.1 hypothetical protein FV241_11690 [Methylobacterium sp. WL2]